MIFERSCHEHKNDYNKLFITTTGYITGLWFYPQISLGDSRRLNYYNKNNKQTEAYVPIVTG